MAPVVISSLRFHVFFQRQGKRYVERGRVHRLSLGPADKTVNVGQNLQTLISKLAAAGPG